jgi:hypothetical protein
MNRIVVLNLFFIVPIFISSLVFGEVSYQLEARGRSKPFSGNILATAAFDQLLWGQASHEDPFYGYLRLGLRGGGSPTYSGFLQIAPIAPLIFEIQKSTTFRFTKISTFDCDLIDCSGRIDRTDYTIRAVGALDQFVFFGMLIWRDIQTGTANKNIGLEIENFEVTPGFHHYLESTLSLGYRLENKHTPGLVITNGVLSEGERKLTSFYFIDRFNLNEYSITLGAGSYHSDQKDQNGLSFLFSISYNWGEKLSLF